MDPETGIVTDSTYRQPQSPAVKESLKKYSEEKLLDAAEREERMLNSPSIFDKFLEGIAAISHKIKNKKTKINAPEKER